MTTYRLEITRKGQVAHAEDIKADNLADAKAKAGPIVLGFCERAADIVVLGRFLVGWDSGSYDLSLKTVH